MIEKINQTLNTLRLINRLDLSLSANLNYQQYQAEKLKRTLAKYIQEKECIQCNLASGESIGIKSIGTIHNGQTLYYSRSASDRCFSTVSLIQVEKFVAQSPA